LEDDDGGAWSGGVYLADTMRVMIDGVRGAHSHRMLSFSTSLTGGWVLFVAEITDGVGVGVVLSAVRT
jgi:hypothetical protein